MAPPQKVRLEVEAKGEPPFWPFMAVLACRSLGVELPEKGQVLLELLNSVVKGNPPACEKVLKGDLMALREPGRQSFFPEKHWA